MIGSKKYLRRAVRLIVRDMKSNSQGDLLTQVTSRPHSEVA